ncbi:MAG: N-acyl amino acid synthase FeeM domain-containing protein [Burkholderiaceae bacterium]
MLVKKMYAWRGYKIAWHAKHQPNRITLVASHGTSPMATISIGFDSPDGLLVDELYKAEIDRLREQGARVCEFTKLAVDGAIRSKRVLATLFHIAYIYSHKMHGFSDLFIEVNPRHVRFYEQMLGFQQLGPERLNARVNAPAVLLRLEFAYLTKQLERFGGKPELARIEKSLYPYGFSDKEERGIMGRLSNLS